MNKTINELTSLTSADSGDELIIYDVSENASKKITKGQILSGMQTELTFDNVPTANSNNPAKSGGIFSSLSVITATSTTITGVAISNGSVIRIMFTSAITGSNTTTGMSISYNGTSIPVKVGKNGSLADFVASDISGTYTYLQAYTTLELAYDGTQFIVIGNPVVYSSDDYTIYADGKNTGWKNLSTNGYNTIDLSAITYSELIAIVTYSNGNFTFNIPKSILSSSVKYFRDGFAYGTNTTALCTVNATLTSISITNLIIDTTIIETDITLNVYYR